MCEKQGVAGIVDVFSFDARHNRAEVGIVVRKDLRGQGVAQTALSLLESHCFSLLGLRQLYALCAGEECGQPEAVHFSGLR